MDSVVSAPVANGDFAADAAAFSAYWRDAKQRLARLPAKPKRDPAATTRPRRSSRPRATHASPSCAAMPARSTTG